MGLAIACAAAHAQDDQLQLGPALRPALPTTYLRQRLDAARRLLPSASDGWREQVRAAYLRGAIQLLQAVVDEQAPDAAAIVGVTLLDGVPALEATLAAAPDAAPVDVTRLWRGDPAPVVQSEADVLALARQAAGPLVALQLSVEPRTVWASAWPPTSPPPLPGPGGDLAALEAKLPGLPVPPQVREPLTAIVQSMSRGARFPEFLPFVDDTCRDMRCVVELIERAEAATWLDAQIKRSLHDELGRALGDYRDPAARPRAAERLSELSAAIWILRNAEEWRAHSSAAARMAETLATQTLRVQVAVATPAAQRRAVFRWHQQVRAATRLTQGLTTPTQPTLRTAFLQAERDWLTAIDGVIRASATLVESPSAINAPSVVEPLRTLHRCAEALAAVSHVKAAMDAVDAFRPVPATGVKQRMMRLADAAKDSGGRERALAEMASFVLQFGRYAQLPLEDALRHGRDAGPAVADKTAGLVQAIDAARTAWATAWASGQRPHDAAEMIEPLRAALVLASRARATDRGWSLVPALDAWAGWQADAEAMRLVFIPLEQATASLIDDASHADFASLRQAVDMLEAEHAMAIAVLGLADGLADDLDTLPQGLPGVLAQTAFLPATDAYMAEQRANVATLNRCVNEWALADEQGRIELRLRATEAIRRMRDDLPGLD